MTHKGMSAGLLLAGLLLANAIAMAADGSDRYITRKLIDSPDGYSLTVPKLGRFKVLKAYSPAHPELQCKVEARSLARQLQKGFDKGRWQHVPGVKVTVELKLHIANGPDGKEFLCSGGGTGCKVEVEVEELMAR